jgi:hypothetical protein
MRPFAALSLLLMLAACAGIEAKVQSYPLGRGLVTYDELRRAKEQCTAAGGVVRPVDAGGDMSQLSNYLCEIQPRKAATS